MFSDCNAKRLYRLCNQFLLVSVLLVGCTPSTSIASDSIAVAVQGGCIFVGQIDRQTDNQQLWLRTDSRGVEIRRPIDWDKVLRMRQGERELSPTDVLGQISTIKETAAKIAQVSGSSTEELPPPNAILPPDPGHSDRPKEWLPDHRLAQFIQAARANNTQVCSIAIDAHVTNWNRTVEADGIVLHVYPLNGLGQTVPVDGTLDVELIAQVPPGAPQGVALPQIGRWTVRVVPNQFGPAGAVIKLPFQNVQPEFNLNVGPYGVVHARLSIPGNGSYETSQAMLCIRPYSAVRDESQQINGERFFNGERVDRWGR